MIGTGRLHMGVVLVEAEIDEARLGFVIPFALAVPEFARAWLERHTIQRDAEPRAATLAWRGIGLRLERDAKRVALRGDGVGVAAIRELSRRVIGQAVRAKDAIAVLDA